MPDYEKMYRACFRALQDLQYTLEQMQRKIKDTELVVEDLYLDSVGEEEGWDKRPD